MDYKKGMSQTLALIVAATVLLMAAMTVVFLTSNVLGDFGNTARDQGCTKTVETSCAAQGYSGKFSPPGSCFADGEPTQTLKDQTWHEWESLGTLVESQDQSINCSTVNEDIENY